MDIAWYNNYYKLQKPGTGLMLLIIQAKPDMSLLSTWGECQTRPQYIILQADRLLEHGYSARLEVWGEIPSGVALRCEGGCSW